MCLQNKPETSAYLPAGLTVVFECTEDVYESDSIIGLPFCQLFCIFLFCLNDYEVFWDVTVYFLTICFNVKYFNVNSFLCININYLSQLCVNYFSGASHSRVLWEEQIWIWDFLILNGKKQGRHWRKFSLRPKVQLRIHSKAIATKHKHNQIQEKCITSSIWCTHSKSHCTSYRYVHMDILL